jgi:dTDP-4-amino-4,6-dideoxygalactose transaminase
MTSDTRYLKKIPSAMPFFEEADIELIKNDINQILKSKRLVLGPYTKKFEELFSKFVGTQFGVAVNSCTAALEIVLRYVGVKDCEVIVPANTFIACPNTVIYAGGKPVFADIDQESFCVDIESVKKLINKKTKAIMPVHLSGLPTPQMNELMEICDDYGLLVIEDCAHAHGATINSKKVGSIGLAGCFSFFATKILPTGTGGMITTSEPKLRDFAEALRHQGGIGGEGQIEIFDKFGYDWMMNEFTAALGINQLSKLEKQIEKRLQIAKQYRESLKDFDYIECIKDFKNVKNVYWKFITILDEKIDRDKVRNDLRTKYNIDAGVLYPTLCYLQPIYKTLGHKNGECPKAEQIMKRQLTLPINPFMTIEDVQYVINSLNEVISSQN